MRGTASIARAEFEARRHFGSLNGIRAIAVLAVVWHHTVVPVSWLPISGRGFLGVDMFFVLSGFLIVTLLLREEDAAGRISLRGFYTRRSLRIFPLYYAVLALMTIYSFGLADESAIAGPFRETAVYHASYLANWFGAGGILAISWSLAAEEQFYLVWPPIQKIARPVAIPVLVVLIGVNQLVNFGVLFAETQPEREILQVTFTPILLGVALAFGLHRHYDRLWPLLGHRAAAPVAAATLLIVMSLPSGSETLVGIHRLTIHLCMVALIATVVVAEDHVLAVPLGIRALVRVGVISYGVYLLHMFVRHVAIEVLNRVGLDTTPLLLFALTVLGVVTAAELSFRFLESPMLRLKRRFQGPVAAPARPNPPGASGTVAFGR